MRYISEEIGNDFKQWGTNDNNKYVLLNGGTGSGKTHFTINVLLKYCAEHNKRILYLCNRKVLKNQIEALIPDEYINNIDIGLFQSYSSQMNALEDI